LNSAQTKGYTGLVTFGIRELNQTEHYLYCDNNQTILLTNEPPLLISYLNFTNDFLLRVFTSGCYYFNSNDNTWSSYGLEVQSTTTLDYTYCQTNHLTEFASGASCILPTLNFNNIWAHASFLDNITLYVTVIAISIIYVILMILSFVLDKLDEQKLGITKLESYYHETYMYEIIIYTGSRKESATDSKVFIILEGENDKSRPIYLNYSDSNRKAFRRGGIDSFIVSTIEPLNELLWIKIWHDNSGKNEMASWYLKHVIVHDLKTREKDYFICEKWLAVEKDNGKIERLLPKSGEAQKLELKYLAKEQTKKNLTDGYLWFSIFSRPLQSTFTRKDRTTNCFVLLFLIVLTSTMFYTFKSSSSSSSSKCEGLDLNIACINIAAILISIIINLILFIPTFIILEIFKRSKPKKSHLIKLKELLIGHNEIEKNRVKNKDKKLRFPWWFKIIGYILSFICIIISIFFTIMYGISMGNDSVSKCFSSIIFSLVISILLTGPIKAILTAILFAIFLKKDSLNDTDDDDDDGTPIVNENNKTIIQNNKNLIISKNENIIDPLDIDEINMLKEIRIKQIKFNKTIKELTLSIITIILLFYICHSFDINSGYRYQSALKNIFKPSNNITKLNDLWHWTIGCFLPSLTSLKSSIIIGTPMIIQSRVKKSNFNLYLIVV
jgi:polycystin 1L2